MQKTRQQAAENDAKLTRELEAMFRQHEAEEAGIIHDVNTYLENRERADHLRKHKLCAEWQEKVYNSIQRQVDAQLETLSKQKLSERRRVLMEAHIVGSSTKRFGQYRDTVMDSEYDPAVARKHAIRYKNVSDADDPLKLGLQAPTLEKRGRGQKPEKPEMGRCTLGPENWDKPEKTQWGYFQRMVDHANQSPERAAQRQDVAPETEGMLGIFDHFNICRDQEVVDRTFPRHKRTFGGGLASSQGFVADSKLIRPPIAERSSVPTIDQPIAEQPVAEQPSE